MSTRNSREKHLSEPAHLFIDTIELLDQVQLEELMLYCRRDNNLSSPGVAWPVAAGAASLVVALLLAALAGRNIGADASAAEAWRGGQPAAPQLALATGSGGVDLANAHNGILHPQ